MAKIRTILENLDETPQALHEFFIEKDGKFVLDLEGIDEHPNVIALKNALERQKGDRKKAVDELKVLQTRLANIPEDFDPEKYATALAELEELKADPARGKDDKTAQEAVARGKMLEQKITSMEKAHNDVIVKKDKLLAQKDTFIGQLLIDEGLTKALVDAGVGKEYLKATKAMLRGDCKVIEDNGEYKAIVESDTGELEIAKYVQDWVASDEGKVFIPPAKGGDSGNTARPAKPMFTDKNPWSKEHFNLTLQGNIIKEDRAKAEKLAKAAGKSLPGNAPAAPAAVSQ